MKSLKFLLILAFTLRVESLCIFGEDSSLNDGLVDIQQNLIEDKTTDEYFELINEYSSGWRLERNPVLD